jgi:hypothetical protein
MVSPGLAEQVPDVMKAWTSRWKSCTCGSLRPASVLTGGSQQKEPAPRTQLAPAESTASWTLPWGQPGVHVSWKALRYHPHVLWMKPLPPLSGQQRLRRPLVHGFSPPSPVSVCVRAVVPLGQLPPQSVHVHWPSVSVRDLLVEQHPFEIVSLTYY